MKCSKCGYTHEGNINFCPQCGGPMVENSQNTYGSQPDWNQQSQYQQQGWNQQNQYQQQGWDQQNQYQQQNWNQQNQFQQQNWNQQNQFQQQNSYTRQPIQQKNIALCVVLCFVTCGIYSIIWFISMVDDLNYASGQTNESSGGIVFLLSLVTCGIYMIYWMYKAGEKVNIIRQSRGIYPDTSTGVLYLVLTIFGLSIVSCCLIQNELNQIGVPQ